MAPAPSIASASSPCTIQRAMFMSSLVPSDARTGCPLRDPLGTWDRASASCTPVATAAFFPQRPSMPRGHSSRLAAHLLLVLSSTPLPLLVACGSGSGGSSPDAAAQAVDASQEGATADSGRAADAGATDGAAPAEGGAASDAPLSESGEGTLTGSQAFPVAWTVMNPREPADECMADAVDGGVAATSIVLAQQDLSSAICGDGGVVTGALVDIEIATQQYATGATSLTQALAPGVYVIGDEGQPDE